MVWMYNADEFFLPLSWLGGLFEDGISKDVEEDFPDMFTLVLNAQIHLVLPGLRIVCLL
jgi:hypothetical protein